jgi:hypothetical protein
MPSVIISWVSCSTISARGCPHHLAHASPPVAVRRSARWSSYGRIGAHEQTVRSWIKTGELKAARFGTRIGYRIRLGDYDDFLRRRTLTSAFAAHLLQRIGCVGLLNRTDVAR